MPETLTHLQNQPWYHGSPLELTVLRAGSTITQDKELARIFSHKPALVSCADDGEIKHNGRMPGFLYIIDEPICLEDIYPHPHTSMEPGKEWLTRREIKVRLLGRTEVVAEEQISEDEIEEFKQRLEKT